jgi:hypothetical protein
LHTTPLLLAHTLAWHAARAGRADVLAWLAPLGQRPPEALHERFLAACAAADEPAARRLLADMRRIAPQWTQGCVLRECFFEPTFHKHVGQLCAGVQIHVEDPTHYDHATFQPWRLQALAFKALRQQAPDYPLWRDFAYEYEHDRLAIDLINGGPALREWVDNPSATVADLDAVAGPDAAALIETR